jgi:hypothetical protein
MKKFLTSIALFSFLAFAYAQEIKPPLELTIMPTVVEGFKGIISCSSKPAFTVSLRNISDKKIFLRHSICPGPLYFEILDKGEKITTIESTDQCEYNPLADLVLDPGKQEEFTINISQNEWKDFLKFRNQTPVKLKAVYEVSNSNIGWVGEVESQSLDAVFYP